MRNNPMRKLRDLQGIGKKMANDFVLLGVNSVEELSRHDALDLYDRMCVITGARQDPCVYDTYRCAIEQARDPDLPEAQKDWWYWSAIRKRDGLVLRGPADRPLPQQGR